MHIRVAHTTKLFSSWKILLPSEICFLWASIKIQKGASSQSCFEVILCRLSSDRPVPAEKNSAPGMQYATASLVPVILFSCHPIFPGSHNHWSRNFFLCGSFCFVFLSTFFWWNFYFFMGIIFWSWGPGFSFAVFTCLFIRGICCVKNLNIRITELSQWVSYAFWECTYYFQAVVSQFQVEAFEGISTGSVLADFEVNSLSVSNSPLSPSVSLSISSSI